jgi:nucleoredoxin
MVETKPSTDVKKDTMRITRILSSVFALLLLLITHATTASDLSVAEIKDDASIVDVTNNNNDNDKVADNLKEALQSSENGTIQTDKSFTSLDTVQGSTTDETKPPIQMGPLIDIFGQQLLTLEMMNDTSAALRPSLTSDALRGKKVIGLYFSADWCGPCRQFTPELVSFYRKMNQRRGRKDEFEIVWISRCRDVQSYGQYFTKMGGWFALPPEEAMGSRGAMLSDKYKVKGIPSLVLLDDLGQVITLDGRNKIPQDKAGIGFPWRNPIATLYMTIIPRSLRLMIRMQVESVTDTYITKVKHIFGQIKQKQKIPQKK